MHSCSVIPTWPVYRLGCPEHHSVGLHKDNQVRVNVSKCSLFSFEQRQTAPEGRASGTMTNIVAAHTVGPVIIIFR